MDNTQEFVEIELCQLTGLDCLKFTFNGNFTENVAKTTIEEWETMIGNVKEGKINMVWDTLKMTGYDSEARIMWQHMLKKYKHVIGTVWVITNSGLIKAGLKLLSTFTSYHFKTVKSCHEILELEHINA
jgi:hypothetical protein